MFFEKYFFTAFLLLSTKSFLETYYTFDKRDNSLFLNELSRMTKGNIFRISPSWKFNCLDTMCIFFSACVSMSLCLSLSLSLSLSLFSHFYQCRYVCTIYLKLHFDNFKLRSTSSYSFRYLLIHKNVDPHRITW